MYYYFLVFKQLELRRRGITQKGINYTYYYLISKLMLHAPHADI